MVGGDQQPTTRVNKARPVSDRYDEQIVEDIVYDIVDEVDFWMQDGFVVPNQIRNRTLAPSTSSNIGGESGEGIMADGEIKELVQDEE